jgi:hypothetical protein
MRHRWGGQGGALRAEMTGVLSPCTRSGAGSGDLRSCTSPNIQGEAVAMTSGEGPKKMEDGLGTSYP